MRARVRLLPRPLSTAALAAVILAGGSAPAWAQAQPVQTPRELRAIVPPAGDRDPQRAEETRRALHEVLQRYPPALGRILKLDPTLMGNQAFMAPYPAVTALLQAHPEVARDAAYFFENVWIPNEEAPETPAMVERRRAMDLWRDVMTGLLVLTIFGTVVLTLSWLVRYFVSHRRWLRAVQIQSDLHSRVMERLGSSEELLTYVQSAAGQHLLQPPAAVEAAAPRHMAAPLGRILWSIQTALVLASAGGGLLVIKQYVIAEVGQMLLVLGVLALSLGVGFGLAAGASYMLSARLGLLDASADASRPQA